MEAVSKFMRLVSSSIVIRFRIIYNIRAMAQEIRKNSAKAVARLGVLNNYV